MYNGTLQKFSKMLKVKNLTAIFENIIITGTRTYKNEKVYM